MKDELRNEEKPVEKKKAEKIELPAPAPAMETTQNILVSETDAYILDRIKSQPKTLEEVDLQVIEKSMETQHRLRLPDELKEYQKKYAFCWLFK